MQTDFRQVYAALLKDWFGASQAKESSALFKDFTASPIFQELVTATEPSPTTTTRLYPNPAGTYVTLESDWLLTEPTTLQVIDMAGRSASISFSRPDTNSVRINISNLTNGTYIVKAETSQGTLTKRLVVLR